MTLKERIIVGSINPNKEYNKLFNELSADNDCIEELTVVLYSGAISAKMHDFLSISQRIITHKDFNSRLDIQYYYNISRGKFYRKQGEWCKALESYETSYNICIQLLDYDLEILTLAYMSCAYNMTGAHEDALFHCQKSIRLLEENTTSEYKWLFAQAYQTLGVIFMSRLEYDKACDLFRKSKEYYEVDSIYKTSINYCICIFNLACSLYEVNKIKESSKMFVCGFKLSDEFGYENNIKGIYYTYSELLKIQGDIEGAYFYLKQYTDSLSKKNKVLNSKSKCSEKS